MKANNRVIKQWRLLVGVSLMTVLLSLTMVSKSASAYCVGWQRDICNHTYKPVEVRVYGIDHVDIWVNDKQSDSINPNSCGYYSVHVTSDWSWGPFNAGCGVICQR